MNIIFIIFIFINIFLIVLMGSYKTAIRKISQDGSLAWMAVLSFNPITKSLAVDTSELYIYVSSATNPLIVARLGASTGSIVDAQN